jgi:hypothetical protein
MDRWIQEHLGSHPWGDGASANPPGDMLSMDFGDIDDDGRPMLVASTGNDGSELWIGYHDKWLTFFKAKDARRLAWFILWEWWAKATWFGLRRWIWYKSLHRIVQGYYPMGNK